MPDSHANFAASTVATAPSPANSGTSLVVASGDGAKFPAVPFNATIWPASTQPTTANAEIVRVTARSTDTLTITRAQESTSARTIVAGDQIVAGITAKTLTDVEIKFPFVVPKSGEYLRSQFCNVFFSNSGPAAVGDMFASPVLIPATQSFTSIAVRIWTGTASSVVRLGMYADDGTGRPGALLNDYGTVTTATSGLKTVTISYAGVAGTLVWLVAVPQTAVPTFVSYNIASAGWGPLNIGLTSANFDGTDATNHAWYVASVTGALPATPTWTVYTANSTRIPVVALVAA